ncbi:MAG: LysR family transcriptional regulator [Rhodoferax sp.]|nr:LysR family transcriptional regulator [Rhodoferax sp.]
MRISFLSLPLRNFLEVARTGSVNQAAFRLHVAASAVSRQLSKLEESLGVVLFERQARGMTLTAAGERLLAHTGASADESDRLVEQLRGLARRDNERVRLACTEGFAAGFMPQVIGAFRASHPAVQFQLRVAVPDEVSGLVQRGEVDLAMKYALVPDKNLQLLHSAVAPVYAIMSPEHPLARQPRVTVSDAVRYPLLMGTGSITSRQLFDLSCSMQGLQYAPSVDCNFSSALFPLIGALDIVLASYLTAARWVDAGLLVARRFNEPQLQQRRLQIVALEGRALTPVVQAFSSALITAVEEHGKFKAARRTVSDRATAPSPL